VAARKKRAGPETIMPRVKGLHGARVARRARVFALVKGFRGKRKNCYSIAVRAAERSMQNAYIGRKQKKREMRRMWIGRVNGAAREHGTNYSTFQHNLSVSEIEINRKVLSELAIHEPKSFKALLDFSKKKCAENKAKPGLAGLL